LRGFGALRVAWFGGAGNGTTEARRFDGSFVREFCGGCGGFAGGVAWLCAPLRDRGGVGFFLVLRITGLLAMNRIAYFNLRWVLTGL